MREAGARRARPAVHVATSRRRVMSPPGTCRPAADRIQRDPRAATRGASPARVALARAPPATTSQPGPHPRAIRLAGLEIP